MVPCRVLCLLLLACSLILQDATGMITPETPNDSLEPTVLLQTSTTSTVGSKASASLLNRLTTKIGTTALAEAEAQTQVQAITPCTMYNRLHTEGDRNCLDCTHIRFSLSYTNSPRSADYVNVRTRDGEFFPLIRPSPARPYLPLAKQTDKQLGETANCMWCPETQRCGHPSDTWVTCAPFGKDGRSQGFVAHEQCADSSFHNGYLNPSRMAEAQELEAAKVEDMKPKERDAYYKHEALNAYNVIGIRDREDEYLDPEQAVVNCFGNCLRSGTSECDQADEYKLPEVVAKEGPGVTASPETPVPCKGVIPKDSFAPMRIFGRFNTVRNEWLTCLLIECPANMVRSELVKGNDPQDKYDNFEQ